MLVFTTVAKVDILTELIALTNYLDGALLHLFTNDHNPAAGDDSTAYTVPTWTGYGAATITWNTPYATPAGAGEVVGDSAFFLSGSDADTITFGMFVLTGGGDLVYAERFTNPVPVVGVTGLTIVPKIDLENLT